MLSFLHQYVQHISAVFGPLLKGEICVKCWCVSSLEKGVSAWVNIVANYICTVWILIETGEELTLLFTRLGWFVVICLCIKKFNTVLYFAFVYTGCLRRNVQYFGRVFLMLNYTDITQNTYIQSWTVKEITAIEKWGLVLCPRTVAVRDAIHVHCVWAATRHI
jgi:hypothetical protein